MTFQDKKRFIQLAFAIGAALGLLSMILDIMGGIQGVPHIEIGIFGGTFVFFGQLMMIDQVEGTRPVEAGCPQA